MNVFFAPCAFLAWFLASLWVVPSARAQDQPTLLIVEVSAADEAAALRLAELSPQPSLRTRNQSARDVASAQALLSSTPAQRAAVLDTAQRRVQVLERDGRVHTRLIESEPTPYQVAFVASELLALPAIPPAPAPAPPTPTPAHTGALARFDATLAADLARVYTTAWTLRPKLALGFWFGGAAPRSVRPLFGLELAAPGIVRRSVPDGSIQIVRWDTALRAGIAVPRGRINGLVFGRALAAVQHADFDGALGTDQRFTSLGLGAGAALELRLTTWLGLSLGADLGVLVRRSLFTLYDQRVLREPLLLFSASLGLAFHTD